MLDTDLKPDDFWWKGSDGLIYAEHHDLNPLWVQSLIYEPRNPYMSRMEINTDYATLPFRVSTTEDIVDGTMWYDYLTGLMGLGKPRDATLAERYCEAIISHETFHGEIQKALDEEWSEKFDYLQSFMDIPPDGSALETYYQCRFSFPNWESLAVKR